MKKVSSLLIAVALLSFTLILPAAFAQEPAGQKPGMGMGMGKGKGGAKTQIKHPELRQAMIKLNEAKTHLHEGARDFEGHKQKAIEHIDEAEKELQMAFQSDKNEQ